MRTDTAADRNTNEYTADACSDRQEDSQIKRQRDRYADIFTEIENWQKARRTAWQTNKQQTEWQTHKQQTEDRYETFLQNERVTDRTAFIKTDTHYVLSNKAAAMDGDWIYPVWTEASAISANLVQNTSKKWYDKKSPPLDMQTEVGWSFKMKWVHGGGVGT
jgi:hypothetical protein